MAQLTFTPPKVQEEILFTSSAARDAAPAAPKTAPSFFDPPFQQNTAAQPPLPTAAFAAVAKKHAPRRHERKSRRPHKSRSASPPTISPSVKAEPALPADFVNLVNTDKVKSGIDTQSVLASQPAPRPKRSRPSADSASESDSAASDSGSGSDSEGSDSDSGSDSEGGRRGRSSGPPPSPRPPPVPSQSQLFDKAKILARLSRRQKMNPGTPMEFNHSMSIEELMTIDAKAGYETQADMSIQLMKRAIMVLVGITERASTVYPQLGLNLKGWGEHVFLNMQQYDETLFEIYDQYSSAFQMNPLVRLAVALASSAWMYSASKAMMEELGTVHAASLEQLQEAIRKATQQQQQQQQQQPQATTKTTAAGKKVGINAAAMKPPSAMNMSSEQMPLDPAKLAKPTADTNVRRVEVAQTASRSRAQGKV